MCVDLLRDFTARDTPARAETAVVAKRAATNGDRAVDIGTRKSRINTDLLNAMPEQLSQIEVIRKKSVAGGAPISRVGSTGNACFGACFGWPIS